MTDMDGVAALEALGQEAVSEGQVPALQIAVAKHGEIVWSGAWGEVQTANGTSPASEAHVFHAYSAGKPVLALALGRALERHGLSWSARVRDFLPELRGEGMEKVTLAHLASHHAGLANAPLPFAEAATRAGRLARMARWAPRHTPGERFAYHAESAWWLLAAVLEQLETLMPTTAFADDASSSPSSAGLAAFAPSSSELARSGTPSTGRAPFGSTPSGPERSAPPSPVHTPSESPLSALTSSKITKASSTAASLVEALLLDLGWTGHAGFVPAGFVPTPAWADEVAAPTLVGTHGAYLPQDAKSVSYRDAYDAHLLELARPDVRALGVPGSGYMSTARELAMFYQQLLCGLKGAHALLSQRCVEALLQVDSPTSLDPNTGAAAMRGRGLVIAGDEQRYLRGFPPAVSARAFGHTGAGGQFGWADPESGLSFALLSSGLERNPLQMGLRGARIGSAALDAFAPAPEADV